MTRPPRAPRGSTATRAPCSTCSAAPSSCSSTATAPGCGTSTGRRYLDLVGGIAVNALGHNHPALVAAVSKQAGQLVHVSNFFTSVPQVELAERLLSLAGAPAGSKVFFCNSGAEALEAAIKLARRTGRTGIVAAEGAFHGRTTGALALTHKPAYREPFEPLIPGVTHVPWGDVDALRAAVTEQTSALVLEPVQGEAGVRPGSSAYLRAAREITREAGALLVLDEVQTGIGRTGTWFAFHQAGVVPDAMTLAKGLGGGVPIGALVTFGPDVSTLLTPGMHGSTFGGNPLACAAGLAVLDTIAAEGLLDHAREAGEHLQRAHRAPSTTRRSPASAAPGCCRPSRWPASTPPPSPPWPATPASSSTRSPPTPSGSPRRSSSPPTSSTCSSTPCPGCSTPPPPPPPRKDAR